MTTDELAAKLEAGMIEVMKCARTGDAMGYWARRVAHYVSDAMAERDARLTALEAKAAAIEAAIQALIGPKH